MECNSFLKLLVITGLHRFRSGYFEFSKSDRSRSRLGAQGPNSRTGSDF
jgi:hypothetical protein